MKLLNLFILNTLKIAEIIMNFQFILKILEVRSSKLVNVANKIYFWRNGIIFSILNKNFNLEEIIIRYFNLRY